MKEIKLTQGKVALVDDEDYERLNKYSWRVNRSYDTYYARCSVGSRVKNYMQHKILLAPPGTEIDHIDRDGLNNQKANLRLCTHSQNLMNQRHRIGCTSEYKGVCWDRGRRKWKTRIAIDGITINLGRFQSEKEAALAYNDAAVKYFGEFARPNIIGAGN